jgi:4-aminobutyrate aminotransferase-like enzyme
VHYAKNPKLFTSCEGSYVFDASSTPFLDLNMQNAAAGLGYKHPRLIATLKNQLDVLPQLASQFLHKEKILLAKGLCEQAERAFGRLGRVHFNVGGAQAIEDALKLIRRNTENPLMFAFMGGYHGRTLGATAITSSYRYREGLGSFPYRALFVPYPYCFRCYYEKKPEDCGLYCLRMFEKLFESEYYGAYNPKTGRSEFAAFFSEPLQGTGGYIVPPKGYFPELARILKAHGVLFVDDEVQMGFMRTGRLFAMEHFGASPDIVAFSKALTGGLNPLSGLWADEALIGPERFGPG